MSLVLVNYVDRLIFDFYVNLPKRISKRIPKGIPKRIPKGIPKRIPKRILKKNKKPKRIPKRIPKEIIDRILFTKKIIFSNFSCMFLNPNNFFQFELFYFIRYEKPPGTS